MKSITLNVLFMFSKTNPGTAICRYSQTQQYEGKIIINYHQCPNYKTFWEKSARSTNLPAHQPLVKFMQIAPLEIQRLLFFI